MTEDHTLGSHLLRSRALPAAVLAAAAVVSLRPLAAQPDDTALFRGSERITAIDLVVEFEPRAGQEWRTARQIPKDLAPGDFEILYDGEPRALVGIEEVGGLGGPGAEAWEVVLYFDAVLTSSRGLRQMASALYERLAELTAFGTVELVWADPEPRTRVAATGDAAPLAAELSEMALAAEGRDELLTLRYQFLGELRNAGGATDDGAGQALGMSPAELARRVAAEEVRIVRRQLDALLARLTAPSDRETARRAVFLVNDGFDLAPHAFYTEVLDETGDSEPQASRLNAATEEVARTLAAYGWVTFNLALPPPPPPPPGWRLGKWLFTPAKPQRMDPDPRYHIVDPADRHTERRDLITAWTFIGGLRGRYQEQRDPERARAYLELGRTLTRQDKTADAEEAFRKAIYHFADDRKWAAKQAEALIELGRLLERRGEQEARHAFAEAYQLDPGLATAQLGPPAALRDPTAPLALFAQATAGWVIQDDDELDRAVATLGHRVRLTYQVSGPPDGEIHPVSVAFGRPGVRLHVPAWARSATPETVSAARARELLRAPYGAHPLLRGNLYLDAALDDAGVLALRLEPPAEWNEDGDEPARLRVTLGFGGPEADESPIEHRLLQAPRDAGRPWSSTVAIDWPELEDQPAFLAVLVEDLAGGEWGSRLIDLAVD